MPGDARLAEARFARNQYNLTFPRFGPFPEAYQQVNLLVAANEPSQGRSAQRLEPARDGARMQHLPSWHRGGEPLDLEGTEIAVLEEIADEPVRVCGDHDSIRLG
jgi:hypothetical protein